MADGDKELKLDLARKKLRQFQKGRHTASDNVSPVPVTATGSSPGVDVGATSETSAVPYQLHYSRESLADSSVSLPNYMRHLRLQGNSANDSMIVEQDAPRLSEGVTMLSDRSPGAESGRSSVFSRHSDSMPASSSGHDTPRQVDDSSVNHPGDNVPSLQQYFLGTHRVDDAFVVINGKPVVEPHIQSVHLDYFNSGDQSARNNNGNIPAASLTSRGVDNGQATTEDAVVPATDFQSQRSSLQRALAEQQQYSACLYEQFQKLQTAYSELAESIQTIGSGEPAPQTQELVQLQQTVAILVSQRAETQSQLRQALADSAAKDVHMRELQEKLQAASQRASSLVEETQGNSRNDSKLAEQAELIARLQERIDDCNVAKADWNQERREILGKLSEKSDALTLAQGQVDCLKKEVALKDVRIKQLSSNVSTSSTSDAEEVAELQAEVAKLKCELARVRESENHWKLEADAARVRFENQSQQSKATLSQLAAEVEASNLRRAESDAKLVDLQRLYDQLNKELEEKSALLNGHAESKSPEPEHSTTNVETELRKANERITFLQADKEMMLMQHRIKGEEIAKLKSEVADLRAANQSLQDRVNVQNSIDTDREELLAALQAEKVTASRAVEQNTLLKSQLAEMQDQFVKMANDNMENASKIQTLEHVCHSAEEKLANIDTMKRDADWQEEERERLRAQISSLEARLTEQTQVQKTDSTTHMIAVETGDADSQTRPYVNHDHGPGHVERVDAVCQHEFNHEYPSEDKHLRDQTEDLQAQLQAANMNLLAKDNLIDELETRLSSLEHHDASVTVLQEQMDELRDRMHEAESRAGRLERENTELHQIMDQNSEDENQNSIRVELQNALDRITQLSVQNDELSREIREVRMEADRIRADMKADAERVRAGETMGSEEVPSQNHFAPIQTNAQNDNENEPPDDASSNGFPNAKPPASFHVGHPPPTPPRSVCSEHADRVVSSEAFEHLKDCMNKLEERFKRAMDDNANLSDQNQYLEHLITNLQSETDTIGEYITLYQHHRKVLRERMKEKEEYIAQLCRDKECMNSKLGELQSLLLAVLKNRGVVQPYHQSGEPVRGPLPHGPSTLPHHAPDNLAQFLADEEQGASVQVPASPSSDSEGYDSDPGAKTNVVKQDSNGTADGKGVQPVSPLQDPPAAIVHDTDRILRLIAELQRPETPVPPVDRNLHCRYCKGKLEVL